MIDKDTHVYCTDCIRWERLLESIMEYGIISKPYECENGCFPYDPEDSAPFYIRKNYVSNLGQT